MTIGAYDTHTLMGVIAKQESLSSYWLDLCFPQVQLFETEYIDFDIVDRGKRLAPFVAPTVQGKPMLHEGYTTKRFKPAYVKPKDIVDPSRVIKRRPGEAYTGSLSQQQRYDAVVADILGEHSRLHRNRQEWMAAQAVINGSITVSGESYPTTTISFGRAGGHTVTLGAGDRWNEAGVNPVQDLEDWALLMLQNSGTAATRVTMGIDAWKAFITNPLVKDQLDVTYRGGAAALDRGPNALIGGVYRGMLGSLEIYTYNDYYEDDTGAQTAILGAKEVVLTGPGLQGVRCFGAIMDADAGFRPAEIFPKMWKQEDPSAIFLMTQSAPLMVPMRPNASFKATVLA